MLPNDYNNEINTIKYLAATNGYEPNLIDKLLQKINKQHRNKSSTNSNKKYITLTYINSKSQKIAHEFKKIGYRVAFKTNNKITKTIKHSQDLNTHGNNKYDRSGVYKLTCTDCSKYYIGQTGHNFTQRYKEHIKALNNNTESSFASHLIDNNHSYTSIENNMSILHYSKKGHKLNTLEQFEIYKHSKQHKTDILNEHTHFHSHTLFESLIEADSKYSKSRTENGKQNG